MTIKEQEMHVCRRLKHFREQARMSQMELALSAGISQNMIAYIENCKRTPTLKTLLKLCEALGISPEVLFRKQNSDADQVRETMHKYIDYYVR